jgi:alpha-L-rhamnosidase
MWEHWDSVNKEGDMWPAHMNSFNHYAYGAVADWIYEVAGGIQQTKNSVGFDELVIEPHPDKRLEWLEVSLETDKGLISSKWIHTITGGVRYEITVPVRACIVIDGVQKMVEKGSYVFYK